MNYYSTWTYSNWEKEAETITQQGPENPVTPEGHSAPLFLLQLSTFLKLLTPPAPPYNSNNIFLCKRTNAIPKVTPLHQYTLIQNLVSVINDCMQRILEDLGIKKKATTYVARHTFSTILKRSGASTEQIQEALGHTDLKTTESYLDSFDKETKKQLAAQLTAFKKKNMAPE